MKRVTCVAVALMLSACALFAPKFTKPTLTIVGIELLNGNFFQQEFKVRLKVHNPNDRPLPVNSLSADMKLGGEPFATGTSTQPFIVAAQGETEFEMRVTANLAVGLLKMLAKPGRQLDAVDYDMTGKVSIDLPFMRSLPFHESGTVSLKGRPAAGSG